MNNNIKQIISCFGGAIALMAILYLGFFGINKVDFSFNIKFDEFLDLIESLSWSVHYFILGVIILCMECLYFKTEKKYYAMILATMIIYTIVFIILCNLANKSLVDKTALIFSIGLLILSLITMHFNKILSLRGQTKKEIRTFNIINSGLIILFCSLISYSYTPPKMTKPIAIVMKKYEQKFKDLGYIDVKSIDNKLVLGENSYAYEKRTHYNFKREQIIEENLLIGILKDNKLIDIFNNDQIQVSTDNILLIGKDEIKLPANILVGKYQYKELEKLFSNMRLEIIKDKLYIDRINQSNSLNMTQKELAQRLDITMELIILPKLEMMKEQNDKKNRFKIDDEE